MAGNGGRQIGQNVEALEVAGFSDGQQTRGGEFAIGATVAETDLAPLHAGAEGAFHAVVGGLDTFVFQEREESVAMLEQSRGEITDFTVGAVQVPLRQGESPFLTGNQSVQSFALLDAR